MLAPIDVVAAEAQVSGFEQSVYSALDDVGRAENALEESDCGEPQSPTLEHRDRADRFG